ncbi:MAG: radical SAM protein [Petrotogales bacterium]
MNYQEYVPGLVVWELTLKCNLKCLHCGSSAGRARDNELSTEEGLKLCDDLAKLGFKGITLFGGEPFLRKDWPILGKRIKDLGLKLSVVSNGFVNPKKIVAALSKLEVDSVQVGLDGTSPQTHDYIRGVDGSFEKSLGFLRSLKEADLSVGAITTVSKMNFKELPKIRDLIIKEGIDWQIQEAAPIGRFPKKMTLSEREYYSMGLFIASNRERYSSEKIFIAGPHNLGFHSKFIPSLGSSIEWDGCWAGKMVLGIQSDGGVKGCLALSDDFIEGNIRERSIVDIWNDPDAFAYNRKFKEEDLGPNCMGCKYGETCNGGCSTRSYSMTGVLHNDRYCFYRIERELFNKTGKIE